MNPKDQITLKATFSILAKVIALIIAAISLISVALILMSVGYAIALKNLFDIAPSQVYRSSFDFLAQSYVPVLVLLNSTIVKDQTIVADLFLRWAPCGGLFIAAVIVISGIVYKKKSRQTSERTKILRMMLANFVSQHPLLTLTCKGWLIGYAVTSSIGFILALLLLSFTIFPYWGFLYGKEELIDNVIKPDHCSLPRSYMIHYEMMQKKGTIKKQEKKIEPGGASCYRVEKDGKELGRGRRVIHAYDTIYLYDPDTSKTTPYDTKGAIVEQITSLKRDDVKKAE